MGIPSYFSYIIKNHSNIINNYQHVQGSGVLFSSLYMDCNSILYDCYNKIMNDTPPTPPPQNENIHIFYDNIIKNVIFAIEQYILFIQPTKFVYIAFDGVAPFAKMEQQKTRRYKHEFMSTLFKENDDKTPQEYSSVMFTPGTLFMDLLCEKIKKHFCSFSLNFSFQCVLSLSDEHGEGEHKLFSHMRQNPCSKDNVALYGLDSDLIMLSLLHFDLFCNIYIFREAQEFIKSSIFDICKHNYINKGTNLTPHTPSPDNNEPYFLDVKELSSSVIYEMNCKHTHSNQICDYIFMCFLLGNDFLPHVPSLNIRTHGMQVLLDVYRMHIGNFEERYLTCFIDEQKSICWKWVNLFLRQISVIEQTLLDNEFRFRQKYNHFTYKDTTKEDILNAVNNIPIIYREDENYISTQQVGWEKRYYKILFDENTTIKNICMNYIEGLEWTFAYYTQKCPDWKWKYHHHYAPLFVDLINYVPFFQMIFINTCHSPFSKYVQLSYVLPLSQHHQLPLKIQQYLHKPENIVFFPSTYKFKHAFKRYFWEAHCVLPNVPFETLTKWENDFKMIML